MIHLPPLPQFNRRSLSEQLAEQLGDLIRRGRWEQGTQLPSVRELAQQFDVSIKTAHDGLRLMEASGLVELKPRRGAFVQEGAAATSAPSRNQVAVIWSVQDEADAGGVAETPDQDNWQFHITRSLELELMKVECHHISLPFMPHRKDGVQVLLRRLEQVRHHLAGVLCFARWNVKPLLQTLDVWDLPWVTVNLPERRSVFNYVAGDNFAGGWELGQCLIRLGVRRALILADDLRASSAAGERIMGLFQAFHEARLSTQGLRVEACDDITEAGGRTATLHCYRQGERPEVIFTTGDWMAVGVLQACQELGVHVPEEVGVVGGTGLSFSAHLTPPLTVLAQPMEEMGRQAAAMLYEMAREGTRRLMGRRLDCSMIFRESLALPPAQCVQPEEAPCGTDLISTPCPTRSLITDGTAGASREAGSEREGRRG